MANALRLDAAADRLDATAVRVADGDVWSACAWVRIAVAQSIDETPFLVVAQTYDYPYVGLTSNADGVTLTAKLTWNSRCSIGALTVGQWYFIGIRVSAGAVSTWRGQAGGSLTRYDDTFAISYDDVPARFAIGGGNYGTANASFSRVRLWDAAISNADMEAEFARNSGAARTAGLIGDWLRPDVELATRLVDYSGANNTLVSSGTHDIDTSAPDLGGGYADGAAAAVGTSTVAATGASSEGSTATASGGTTAAATGAWDVGGVAAASGASTVGALGAAVGVDWSQSMPLISVGKPVFGTGVPGRMADGGFGYVDDPGAWASTTGSWVAVQVGAGPSQVLVGISSDLVGSSYTANSFASYRLQTSPDSTNGVDGTWTTRVTVTGNPVMSREHLIAFSGESWVKLILDSAAGDRLDELLVWDASAGTPDTFVGLGDSITHGWMQRLTFFGGGNTPSFQTRCASRRPGHFPLQVNCGATGQGSAYWQSNIASVLAMHADCKYWLVAVGINDATTMPSGLASFRSAMTSVLEAIVAAGRVPIVARVSWTGAAGYGGGDYETCQIRYLNDNGIDWLIANVPGVRRGPDLYAVTYANRVAWALETDPHPNNEGQKGWSETWAAWVAPELPSVAASTSTSTAGAVGSAVASASAAAAGASVATSTGQAWASATATASGGSTATAASGAMGDGAGAAAGASSVAATGSSLASGAGASSGSSSAAAVGAPLVGGVGASAGASSVSATGAALASATAASAGASTAVASGTASTGSWATTVGASTATATGAALGDAVGASSSSSVVAASGGAEQESGTAVAAGVSTVAAVGGALAAASAASAGYSVAAAASVGLVYLTSTPAAATVLSGPATAVLLVSTSTASPP